MADQEAPVRSSARDRRPTSPVSPEPRRALILPEPEPEPVGETEPMGENQALSENQA